MKFINLFPTVLFGQILSFSSFEIQEFKKFVLNSPSKTGNEGDGSYTLGQTILNNKLFLKLRKEILNYSKIYLDKLNHEYEDIQISNSWANSVGSNESIHSHSHANSYISGVFYFDNSSDIEFTDPLINQWAFKSSTLSTTSVPITPLPNLLLLFPSFLYHRVIPNQNTQTRLSIAFNIIPKGEFGPDTGKLYL